MTATTVLRSEPHNRSTHLPPARFHSPRGALGALGLLVALPITIVFGMLFPVGGEVVVHLVLVLGVLSSVSIVGLGVWAMVAGPATGTPQELRLLYLLPFAWFLFVSTRRSSAR
jgi:hypothetical protein